MIVYVSAGNSDDKLSQRDWACMQIDLQRALHDAGGVFHGEWYSNTNSIYQNMCICLELDSSDAPKLKERLAALAKTYRQDSIAWAVAPSTEFLSSAKGTA